MPSKSEILKKYFRFNEKDIPNLEEYLSLSKQEKQNLDTKYDEFINVSINDFVQTEENSDDIEDLQSVADNYAMYAKNCHVSAEEVADFFSEGGIQLSSLPEDYDDVDENSEVTQFDKDKLEEYRTMYQEDKQAIVDNALTNSKFKNLNTYSFAFIHKELANKDRKTAMLTDYNNKVKEFDSGNKFSWWERFKAHILPFNDSPASKALKEIRDYEGAFKDIGVKPKQEIAALGLNNKVEEEKVEEKVNVNKNSITLDLGPSNEEQGLTEKDNDMSKGNVYENNNSMEEESNVNDKDGKLME